MNRQAVIRFALKVLLLLPVAFALWVLLGPWLARLLAIFTELGLQAVIPRAVAQVAADGTAVEIITRLLLPPSPGQSGGQYPVLAFNVNTMVYGYGLPFFTALLVATPGGLQRANLLKAVCLALPLLLLVNVWGICFDTLKTLAFDFHATVGGQLGLSTLQRNLIGYGFQLGSLILPPVVPVLLWLWCFPAAAGMVSKAVARRY